jgi:hypothetical protein
MRNIGNTYIWVLAAILDSPINQKQSKKKNKILTLAPVSKDE